MPKAEVLRQMTDDELSKFEKDTKEELFNIRMQVSTRQITNYARIKQLKKDIARLETVKKDKRV